MCLAAFSRLPDLRLADPLLSFNPAPLSVGRGGVCVCVCVCGGVCVVPRR